MGTGPGGKVLGTPSAEAAWVRIARHLTHVLRSAQYLVATPFLPACTLPGLSPLLSPGA